MQAFVNADAASTATNNAAVFCNVNAGDFTVNDGTADEITDNKVIGISHEGELLEGVVFCECGGKLYASATELVTATSTLVFDLALTLGISLVVVQVPLAFMSNADAAFLISDEFGYVPIELNRSASTPSTPSAPSASIAPAAPLSKKIEACLTKVIP